MLGSLRGALQVLVLLVEGVAFRRMGVRLVHWLEAGVAQGVMTIAHQEVAVELGTAREVVSRLLKEFERKGMLRLARGKIEFTSSFPGKP